VSTRAAAVGENAHLGTKCEEMKHVAIAIVELRLSEGISQSVSQ